MRIIAATLLICLTLGLQANESKPNVLFIAIDDLNDWVGALNGHPDTRTPNIDRLAKRGMLFSNAHCQAPICNPSRTSLMFGLRPSTTGFYDNLPNSADVLGFYEKHTSLPRHFSANGYKTLTTGKIYHDSLLPPNDFETVGPRPGQMIDLDKRVVTDLEEPSHPLWDFGPQAYSEEDFVDYSDTSWAIEQLQAEHERPFFLTLGLYRPHVPLYVPERIYQMEQFSREHKLPVVKSGDRNDISDYAKELVYNPIPPSQDWLELNDNKMWHEIVRCYLASIHWTDEQVGRILDALDTSPYADNTIVVLYSDHGYHLGEKRQWAKRTLWERATRVPFIISTPGERAGVCDKPVELLSIYPTLIELCGLSSNPEVEGISVLPLLENPDSEWLHAAVTTLFEGNHSVRTQTWRYISYADGSEELYDHRIDPNEWTNLAGDPAYSPVINQLRHHLPRMNVPQVSAN